MPLRYECPSADPWQCPCESTNGATQFRYCNTGRERRGPAGRRGSPHPLCVNGVSNSSRKRPALLRRRGTAHGHRTAREGCRTWNAAAHRIWANSSRTPHDLAGEQSRTRVPGPWRFGRWLLARWQYLQRIGPAWRRQHMVPRRRIGTTSGRTEYQFASCRSRPIVHRLLSALRQRQH